MIFPILMLGIGAFFVYPKEKNSKLFHYALLPGMIYTFCIYLSSNQAFYAISSAATVPAVISIVMYCVSIYEIIKHINSSGKVWATVIIAAISICFSIGSESYLRYNDIFFDTGINEMTVRIEYGPEKGLYTSEGKAANYYSSLEATREIRNHVDSNKIFYASLNTWLYLCGNNRIGTYSPWILSGGIGNILDKLSKYYEINPDNQPNVVYSDWSEEYFEEFFVQKGYSKRFTQNGIVYYLNSDV